LSYITGLLGSDLLDAVILAGGRSLRTKPFTWIDKPFLEIKDNYTLLEYQIDWLLRSDRIDKVIVAIHESQSTRAREISDLRDRVELCIEKERLGTGGGVKNAVRYIYSDFFYLMNVDDILLDLTPDILIEAHLGSSLICLTYPTLPYGVARLSGYRVVGFEEKPRLKNLLVNCGHYIWSRRIVKDLFPDLGDFEKKLNDIAKFIDLRYYIYSGRWLTVTTLKDWYRARIFLGSS